MPSSQLSLYELHYNLGHVLHQQGKLAESAQSYRQTISLQPHYANAHLNLAIVLDEQGQFAAAIHHYRQVIALQPDCGQAYNNLGCTLAKLKEWDAAIEVYQQAIDLHPHWATLYNNLGQALQSQGKHADAIAAYRRAIELQSDLVLAHHNLGKALQAQGHHAKAIAVFQQVIQLDPNCLPAYSHCSASWMAQGKIKEALPYLHQSVVRQRKFVEAFCQWTAELDDRSYPKDPNLSDRANQPDQLTQARIACSQFLHTLLHQPDSPTLHTSLAQTYLHLAQTLSTYGGEGQYRQAQTYYQWVLQLQPNHLEAYLGLGNCLVQQGKQNAAIFIYHLALQICPHPIPLHLQLGQTLERQQKFAEAIVHYQQALQLQLCDRTKTAVGQNPEAAQWNTNKATAALLPQGIYASTQNWIATANPNSTHYIKLQPPHSHIPKIPHSLTPSPPHSPTSSCHGLNCQPCLKQILDRFQLTHLGQGIYAAAVTQEWATQPLLFVANIANGSVWTAPQQSHWQVCNAIAVLTPDRHLLGDLSRDYPGELPGCQHPGANRHSIFQQTSLPVLERIDGTVAVLTGLSGHNYYHWLVDVLPRLALLRASDLNLSEVDWFLFNSVRQPFQRTTLAALGVSLEKVIASDEHPHIQAQQLVVPSFAGFLGWPEPWALEFLRQQFLPLAAQSSLSAPYPERIYISRSQASHRRVLNEAEVIQQLESYGFVSIQLESLSFIDQIALFTNAKIIVAPHGGGLTNTIFCHAETTIVELVNLHYIRHYYLAISQQLSLRHYVVVGEVFACHPIQQLMYPSPLMEDIWVNLESLARLLHTLLV